MNRNRQRFDGDQATIYRRDDVTIDAPDPKPDATCPALIRLGEFRSYYEICGAPIRARIRGTIYPRFGFGKSARRLIVADVCGRHAGVKYGLDVPVDLYLDAQEAPE